MFASNMKAYNCVQMNSALLLFTNTEVVEILVLTAYAFEIWKLEHVQYNDIPIRPSH